MYASEIFDLHRKTTHNYVFGIYTTLHESLFCREPIFSAFMEPWQPCNYQQYLYTNRKLKRFLDWTSDSIKTFVDSTTPIGSA